MKRISVILSFLLALCFSSFAQLPSTAPVTGPFDTHSQMWNTSNVYRNVPFWFNNLNTNLGTQIDTAQAQTIYLYTAKLYPNYQASVVNADTFQPASVPPGSQTISFIANVWKGQLVTTTVNPTVVITPQASFDGIVYANIPGQIAATLTPTSGLKANALTAKWDLTALQGNFFRIKNVVTGDTAAIQNFWDAQRVYSGAK
jgi:hypothetical protein